MSQSSRYAQRALTLSREVEAKDARIAELEEELKTMAGLMIDYGCVHTNAMPPKSSANGPQQIVYWPVTMGDK